MNDTNAQTLARSTYTLDLSGILAHLRDTLAHGVSRITRGQNMRIDVRRAGSRQAHDVITRHHVVDSWRIR